MTIERDLVEYHRSIAAEMLAVKDRIRNLIGSNHWLSDGEHKKAILRRILKTYIPESLNVGKGFICYPNGDSSKQLDILITAKNKPTLFKEGELVFVTPDSVEAIIEVKTRQTSTELKETAKAISKEVGSLRKTLKGGSFWSGIFVFDGHDDIEENENSNCRNDSNLLRRHKKMLEVIQEASEGDLHKAIDCVALGLNTFVRFWRSKENLDSSYEYPAWHSYNFSNSSEVKLSGLAQAYFLSNVVWHLNKVRLQTQFAWFPIEKGKEKHRNSYMSLSKEFKLFNRPH
jgi:hypothetical protein